MSGTEPFVCLAGGRIVAPGKCLSDHCQAAVNGKVNGETLTVRKAEFGIVYIFIGACLKLIMGPNAPSARA
jgi:hypothetical protein